MCGSGRSSLFRKYVKKASPDDFHNFINLSNLIDLIDLSNLNNFMSVLVIRLFLFIFVNR